MTKDTVRIGCSRCGITERHANPEIFVEKGWTARDFVPLCPQCRKNVDEYEEFRKYFDFLKQCETGRLAILRSMAKE